MKGLRNADGDILCATGYVLAWEVGQHSINSERVPPATVPREKQSEQAFGRWSPITAKVSPTWVGRLSVYYAHSMWTAPLGCTGNVHRKCVCVCVCVCVCARGWLLESKAKIPLVRNPNENANANDEWWMQGTSVVLPLRGMCYSAATPVQ